MIEFILLLFFLAFIYILYKEYGKKEKKQLKEVKTDKIFSKEKISEQIKQASSFPNERQKEIAKWITVFCEFYSTDLEVKKETITCSPQEYIKYSNDNGLLEENGDLKYYLRKIKGDYERLASGDFFRMVDEDRFNFIYNGWGTSMKNYSSRIDRLKWISDFIPLDVAVMAVSNLKNLHKLMSENNLTNMSQLEEYVIQEYFNKEGNGYLCKNNECEEKYEKILFTLPYLYLLPNYIEIYTKITDYNNKLAEFRDYFNEVKNTYRITMSGIDGEKKSAGYVSEISDKVLYNVTIKSGNDTAENDILLFSKKGIFTLEVKNYGTGDLTITENGQVNFIKNGEEVITEKTNPIEQTNRHVALINKILGEKISAEKVRGMIVLPDPKVNIDNKSTTPVVSLPFLQNYIDNNYEDVLSEEELDWAYQKIQDYSIENIEYSRPIMTQNWIGLWAENWTMWRLLKKLPSYPYYNFERDEGEGWADTYHPRDDIPYVKIAD